MRDYSEVFKRHKGPYHLVVWRTAVDPKTGAAAAIDKQIIEKTDDPADDARMLLEDPRDSVTSVDIWSVSEQQYAISINRRDLGLPELSVPSEPVKKPLPPKKPAIALTETSADTQPADVLQFPKQANRKKKEKPMAKKATKKTAAEKGRGNPYSVKDKSFAPGGDVAARVWAAMKKLGSFTVAEVVKELNYKVKKANVAWYANTWKNDGALSK